MAGSVTGAFWGAMEADLKKGASGVSVAPNNFRLCENMKQLSEYLAVQHNQFFFANLAMKITTKQGKLSFRSNCEPTHMQ